MDLVNRLNPAVERRWLLLVAGCLWTAVGLIAALVIYRFGFLRLALRNIARIGGVKAHVCVFAFQAWKSYLIVAFMMGLGIFLRGSPIPKPDLAALYIGIGGGLLLSSIHYYRELIGTFYH